MLAMLAKMSVHASTVTSAVAEVARCVLGVNSTLFDLATSFGRSFVDSVTKGTVQVRSVLCRTVEDFGSFTEDVYGMTASFFGAVTQGISHIFSTVNTASALVVGGVATVGTAILGFGGGVCVAAQNSICAVVWGASMLFRAVLLTVHSVIFTIGMLPSAIYIGIGLMLNGALDRVWIIKDSLKEVCVTSVRAVITFSRRTFATIAAIPFEFFCGLAILVLIAILVRYLKRSLRCRRYVARLRNALRIGNRVGESLPEATANDRYRNEQDNDDVIIVDQVIRNAGLQADTVERQVRPQMRRRRPSRPPTPPSPPILRSANLRDEISQLKRQLTIAQDSRLCIVCQDREKCVITLPCRHMCLCQECSEQILTSCPICRHYILDKFQVFS